MTAALQRLRSLGDLFGFVLMGGIEGHARNRYPSPDASVERVQVATSRVVRDETERAAA